MPNQSLNGTDAALGWTHSRGSGKSMPRIVRGLAPEVDFASGSGRAQSGVTNTVSTAV